jgi:acid stress-induced BolA-like protein IbaG/YrbA
VVTPEELKERIETAIPGARAEVVGDGRHRRVYGVFGAEVGDRIHALSLKTGANT